MKKLVTIQLAMLGLGFTHAGYTVAANDAGAPQVSGIATAHQTENGLSVRNGLTGFNGLSGTNGLTGFNGLTGTNGVVGINGLVLSDAAVSSGLAPEGHWLIDALRPENGISVAAGLSTDAGLANGIGAMATEGGARLVSYLVKCALPADRTIEKYDAEGKVHVFRGSVGVAAEWEAGACRESCQEWMSACLLAHVNLTGRRVGIWLTADHPAVDLTTSSAYPLEEAAYFGNLFSGAPEAYVCNGRQAAEHPIAGRVCSGSRSCPYIDPYALAGGSCEALSSCTPGQAPSGERSGYTDCRVGERTWSHVVTAWKP